MAFPDNNDFGYTHFPPQPVVGDELTGKQELYPERIQDDVNNYYTHDKSMPRIAGVDYQEETKLKYDDDKQSPESVSTFPHKY